MKLSKSFYYRRAIFNFNRDCPIHNLFDNTVLPTAESTLLLICTVKNFNILIGYWIAKRTKLNGKEAGGFFKECFLKKKYFVVDNL